MWTVKFVKINGTTPESSYDNVNLQRRTSSTIGLSTVDHRCRWTAGRRIEHRPSRSVKTQCQAAKVYGTKRLQRALTAFMTATSGMSRSSFRQTFLDVLNGRRRRYDVLSGHPWSRVLPRRLDQRFFFQRPLAEDGKDRRILLSADQVHILPSWISDSDNDNLAPCYYLLLFFYRVRTMIID